jgi:DNA-binding MarR family transcriptional regulator
MSYPRDRPDAYVGYLLKRTQAALRNGLDDALRPLGLTAPQYSCLRLLRHDQGISNSELARGAFVTRQSMNTVVKGLHDRGLISRPQIATAGRELPVTLTRAGVLAVEEADVAADALEAVMVEGLTAADIDRLSELLRGCAERLEVAKGSS